MDRTVTERIFFKVFLVIFLGAVKFIGGLNLRDDRIFKDARTVKQFLRFFGGFFLFRRIIKNGRAILRTNIGALAIERRRIVMVKKEFQKILVAHARRVVSDLDGLRMSGLSGANLLVA